VSVKKFLVFRLLDGRATENFSKQTENLFLNFTWTVGFLWLLSFAYQKKVTLCNKFWEKKWRTSYL